MTSKGIIILLSTLVVVLFVAVLMLFQSPTEKHVLMELSYSQLLEMGSKLRDATIRGDELTGHDDTGLAVTVQLPHEPSLADRLVKNGTRVTIGTPRADSNWLQTLLVNGLPLVAWIFVWLYPLRRIARALEALVERTAAGPAPAPPMDATGSSA